MERESYEWSLIRDTNLCTSGYPADKYKILVAIVASPLKGAVAYGNHNQHNFFITKGMTLFFIYLCTELNYLSNDIILCSFVVVIYTLYRWTSQI